MNILVILLSPLILIAASAPVGATVCGAVAISRIRQSEGKLVGLKLALVDALLFPLLALDGLLAWVLMALFHVLVRPDPTFGPGEYMAYKQGWYALIIVVCLVVDSLIVRWAWRATRRPGETALPSPLAGEDARRAGLLAVASEGYPSTARRVPTGPCREAGDEGTPNQSGGDAAGLHNARRSIKSPAIGLLIAAGVHLISLAAMVVYFLVTGSRAMANPAMVMGVGLSLLVNVYVAIAAFGMSQLQNYRRSLIGSILAIGLSLSPLGLLFGIWALVILTRREIIEAFKTPNKGEYMSKSKAFIWALIAITVIVTSAAVWAASKAEETSKTQPATQPAPLGEPFLGEHMRRAIADELHARGVRFRDVKVTPLINTGILDCTFTTLEELKNRDGSPVWTPIKGALRIDCSSPAEWLAQGRDDLAHVAFTIHRSDLVATRPAPHVLKTTPAAFANDVDPLLDKITVTFDRPMMDKSWSFTAGDKAFSEKTGAMFPERAGEISYDTVRTTCTLPVKLQPGKVYWVGVNSPQLQNFKSAVGVPARPYQILFVTRSADDKPTPLPEELVRQAREINATAADTQAATQPALMIQPGDTLRIRIIDGLATGVDLIMQPQVPESGTILLGGLEPIRVQGLTLDQARMAIAEACARSERIKSTSVAVTLLPGSATRPANVGLAVQQVASQFLTALRDKNIEAMKALSLGSVRGWISDEQIGPRGVGPGWLAGMNVERLESATSEIHREAFSGNVEPLTKIDELVVNRDWAAVKVTVPNVSGAYLIVIFTQTPAGWRFVTADGARKPMSQEFSERVSRIREVLAAPATQPATADRPVPPGGVPSPGPAGHPLPAGEGSVVTQPATQPTTQTVADAMAATQAWLALLDEGKTEASWEQAAKSFRSSITKNNWAAALKVARVPLGKLRSRKLISSTYTTSLPGAPDGQYVIVQFETVFENKPQAVETLTPMLEADGKWRISGYYVK